MNRALAGFLIELCFTVPAGVWLGRFIYVTPRGIAMNAAAKAKVAAARERFGRALDWIGHGRRLAALIVVMIFLVLAAYGYTYKSAQSSRDASERERTNFYACVSKYVGDLSRTNLPRTIASIEASNARFNWDVGHDKMHPSWSKAELKAEYVRLYRAYQKSIASNPPLPAFSAQYCESGSSPLPLIPKTEPTKKPSAKVTKKPSSTPQSAGNSTTSIQVSTGHRTPRPTQSGTSSSGERSTGNPIAPSPTGELLPGAVGLICAAVPVVCDDLLKP